MSQSETEQQKRERGTKGGEQARWGGENREKEDQPENREMKPMEPKEETNRNEAWAMRNNPGEQKRRKDQNQEE
jgi:hypothetical protein